MKDAIGIIKKLNKKQLYGILIIGVLLLLLSSGLGAANDADELKAEAFDYGQYTKSLEESLEKALNQIQGISEAEAMVTLESGFEYIPAYETGGDSFGSGEGEQEKLIVLKKQGGSEEAFILKERLPTIKGVLVIAKGVGSSEAERNVVEAVKTVFDISASRVKVLAK